jgi:hypothetical protein
LITSKVILVLNKLSFYKYLIRLENFLVHRPISRPWGRSVSDGLTLVPDISNITSSGIKNIVSDNLGTTIRKGNTVFTVGGVSIAVLIVSKLSTSGVSISLNSISEIIDWRSILVDRGWSISWDWGRSIRRNWSRGIWKRSWGIWKGSWSVRSWGVWKRSWAVGSWCNSEKGSRSKSDGWERSGCFSN